MPGGLVGVRPGRPGTAHVVRTLSVARSGWEPPGSVQRWDGI